MFMTDYNLTYHYKETIQIMVKTKLYNQSSSRPTDIKLIFSSIWNLFGLLELKSFISERKIEIPPPPKKYTHETHTCISLWDI